MHNPHLWYYWYYESIGNIVFSSSIVLSTLKLSVLDRFSVMKVYNRGRKLVAKMEIKYIYSSSFIDHPPPPISILIFTSVSFEFNFEQCDGGGRGMSSALYLPILAIVKDCRCSCGAELMLMFHYLKCCLSITDRFAHKLCIWELKLSQDKKVLHFDPG